MDPAIILFTVFGVSERIRTASTLGPQPSGLSSLPTDTIKWWGAVESNYFGIHLSSFTPTLLQSADRNTPHKLFSEKISWIFPASINHFNEQSLSVCSHRHTKLGSDKNTCSISYFPTVIKIHFHLPFSKWRPVGELNSCLLVDSQKCYHYTNRPKNGRAYQS